MSGYTGRGPTKARTTLNTNLAVVVVDDTLTKAETNLVAAGEIESVLQQRHTFDRTMRAEAVAAIKQETGRRVRAYLSDIAPEAAVGAHVFVFEPEPETGSPSRPRLTPSRADRRAREARTEELATRRAQGAARGIAALGPRGAQRRRERQHESARRLRHRSDGTASDASRRGNGRP